MIGVDDEGGGGGGRGRDVELSKVGKRCTKTPHRTTVVYVTGAIMVCGAVKSQWDVVVVGMTGVWGRR